MRSIRMPFILLTALLLVSLSVAGVLWISQERSGTGTKFTLGWGQGCIGGVGPGQCASVKPKYCPPDSTGTTPLVDNCQVCGCKPDYECKSDGTCKICDNPCSPDPCGTCESCTIVDRCAGTYRCDAITPCCGNGKCESGEDCSSCEADCGPCSYCGDGTCDTDEDCSTCSSDCGGCTYCESAQEEGGGLCVSGGSSRACSSDTDCP